MFESLDDLPVEAIYYNEANKFDIDNLVKLVLFSYGDHVKMGTENRRRNLFDIFYRSDYDTEEEFRKDLLDNYNNIHKALCNENYRRIE